MIQKLYKVIQMIIFFSYATFYHIMKKIPKAKLHKVLDKYRFLKNFNICKELLT